MYCICPSYQIYEGITRLANAYVKICAAGSILFEKWKCLFYCDPGRPVVVNIDIQGLNKTQQLVGEAVEGLDDVSDHIIELCQFMEECLNEWTKDINGKRTQFCHLNYFTTAQLVILRNELAKVAFSNYDVSCRVYPMLDSVKNNCSEEDIRGAIKETLRAMQEEQSPQPSNDSLHEPIETQEEVEENTERQQFLQQIQDMGLSRKMAERAAEQFQPDEIDDGNYY